MIRFAALALAVGLASAATVAPAAAQDAGFARVITVQSPNWDMPRYQRWQRHRDYDHGFGYGGGWRQGHDRRVQYGVPTHGDDYAPGRVYGRSLEPRGHGGGCRTVTISRYSERWGGTVQRTVDVCN